MTHHNDAGSDFNMSTEIMEQEVASFARHVAEALRPLRMFGGNGWKPGQIKLGHQPVADWDTSPCQCGTGAALGQGRSGLKFLEGMLRADSAANAARATAAGNDSNGFTDKADGFGLYSPANVDYLVSHSYPYSMAAWGNVKAYRGLTYYRNESETVGRKGMPTMITETGWRRDESLNITDQNRANWTLLAYSTYWLDDPQVLGVHPFLLAGKFWDALGWPWMTASGGGADGGEQTLVPSKVFTAIKGLRCAVLDGGGGDCN